MSDRGVFREVGVFLREAERLTALGDEASLRYACLQVRMCIETVFYRWVPVYRKELPDSVISEWKPRAIIDAIIACNPMAQYHHSVKLTPHGEGATAIEAEIPPVTKELLRDYYHELGSRLHAPRAGEEFDHAGTVDLLNRAMTALARHDAVTMLMNFPIGIPFRCQLCRREFRKSILGIGPIVACPNSECSARYDASLVLGGARLTLRSVELQCPSCSQPMRLLEHLCKPGYEFRCMFCRCPWRLEQSLALVSRWPDLAPASSGQTPYGVAPGVLRAVSHEEARRTAALRRRRRQRPRRGRRSS